MALRKQKITIPSGTVGSLLTDYPMLVARVHLDDEVVDPSGSNAAQVDGGDLKFYSDSALTNRIACEVVHFEHDSSTGADDAVIEVHVVVPSVASAADTDIWMTYNEPSATSQPARDALYGSESVWDADYLGVWHLSEDPSGSVPQMNDSTANEHHGTTSGSMTSGDVVDSQIGQGLDLDGTNDHIDLMNVGGGSAVHPADFTVEAVFRHTYNGSTLVDSNNDASVQSFYFGLFNGNTFVSSGTFIDWGPHAGIAVNTWNYAAYTHEGTNGRLRLNGSTAGPVFMGSMTWGSYDTPLRLGCTVDGLGRRFAGIYDSFRFSSIARSDDWTAATRINQFTPATFATAGTPADVRTLADAKPFAVAAWALDEASGTRADQVGSSDLTDNATVGVGTGKFSNAADFEADSSEFLNCADNAALSTGNIDFCIRAWVKLESKGSNRIIVNKADATQIEYDLRYDSTADRFRFYVASASGFTNLTSVDANNLGSPALDTWYLIHAKHSATNNQLGIAVNAGTENTAAYSHGCYDSNAGFQIGAFRTNGETPWDGLIDDVVILKGYILDPVQRALDYNSGNGVAFADWDGGGGGTEYPESVSDTITYSDAQSNLVVYARTLTDILTYSDILAHNADYIRALVDTLTLEDVAGNAAEYLQEILDTLTITDDIEVAKESLRELVDAISFSDASVVAKEAIRSLADTLSLTDDLSSFKESIQSLIDTLTLTDVLSSFKESIQALEDILTYSDSVSSQTDFIRALVEILEYVDEATPSLNAQQIVTDLLTYSDSVTIQKIAEQSLEDLVTFVDELINTKESNQSLANIILLADELINTKESNQTLTDILLLTDSARRISGLKSIFPESNYGIFGSRIMG